MYLDIHSHILPDVDDGAKDLKESLELLKLMKRDGISHVIATSHFYPELMNYEQYIEVTSEAFETLKTKFNNKKLPRIYLGCEMLYYKGIGNCEILDKLCLNKSKYLLLELTDYNINEDLFEDLNLLLNEQKIIPIIAHIERYYRAKNFKKLLKFVLSNNIPVQINASSLLVFGMRRKVKKIVTSNAFCVLATDAHSVDERPPVLKEAFNIIEKKMGAEYHQKLRDNASVLYKEIIME